MSSLTEDVAFLRRRYPEGLICVRCAVLLATRPESYAKSNLTEADRVAFVCAGCRLDKAAADRVAVARAGNLAKARAVQAEQRASQGAEERHINPHAGGNPGAMRVASADPHWERLPFTGKYDSSTRRRGARRGGRPRLHPGRRAAVAAASRAYRARKRATVK